MIADGTRPSKARQDLLAALGAAGRLWRNRGLLEGACVVGAAVSVVAAGAIAAMDGSLFLPPVVTAARWVVYTLAAVLAVVFLVLRVPRSRDHVTLARHLETREPGLDALLITAVERARARGDAPLEQRLYRRAALACRDPAGATRADRVGLRRAGRSLAALVLALVVALLLAPAGWRHAATLLAMPWQPAETGTPYALAAVPGDVSILEGTDLAIGAEARGFVPERVVLMVRPQGTSQWTRTSMTAPEGGRVQPVLMTAVATPFDYFVVAGGVQSPRHRVSVQPLPRVARMDHHYRFPAYTGMPERVVEQGTDIAAVTGSQVRIHVQPSTWPASGELVLDGQTRRPLAADGERLSAELSVDEASRYRIELALPDGTRVAATPEHGIDALDDGAPSVSVVRPGGDTRVTAVEEVQVEVRAQDDVGLRGVELVLSVNGEPEQVVPLRAGGETVPLLSTVHSLFLEERKLTPGDVIAFHARASDGVESRAAVTDIRFMEVRPFDRDYRRGRSSGQQGGGGQQQGAEGLAAQQRDLVVALFRLTRDGDRLPPEEREERLTTLSAAQARIRERVEAIVRRIKGRTMVRVTPGFKTMLEELPRAASAMTRVEALLAVPDPEQGLPPAREALAHLQRADAAFREVQVASQSGSGGAARQDSGDLSRLFELEMDRFQNRYSQVQRGAMQQRQQQVDETLEKLRELARRQREEVARARRRALRSDLAGRGAPTQQALAQELDRLLRQLERLTREQSSAAMEQARRSLQAAAEAMRRSGEQGARQGERGERGSQRPQAGRDQDRQSDPSRQGQATPRQGSAGGQQASGSAAGDPRPRGGEDARTAAARQALEALEQARRALAGDQSAQVARALDAAKRRAEDLVQRQNRLREALRAGSDEPGDQAPELAAKERLEADASALREQLDRIAGSSASRQPEVARRAREAAGVMRDRDVEARLRRSREELARGRRTPALEEAIADALEATRDRVAEAAAAAEVAAARAAERREGAGARDRAGVGPGGSTPEEMRALMRELAGLRERLERGLGADGTGPGGRNASDLRAWAGELERLRGPVARNPGPAGDLRALIEGIEALAGRGGETGGDADPRAMLETIDALERALRTASGDEAAAVVAERHGDAPEGYRALVEQYFKTLSEQTP